MKKHWLLGAAAMMLASSVVAQSSNNEDEVVKIERHAARDYREGEMIVKFKPTSAVRVRSLSRGVTSGVSGVDKVLGELGITASEQLMPLTGSEVTPRAKALRSVSGNTIEDSDMSQLYRLTFDAEKVNVHEAIDKLSALDEVEFAEPNYVVYALSTGEVAAADDPLKGEQWGHGQLKLDFLQKQKPITDKRPVIAILDTGIDIEHPDLKDNIWTNEAELNGAEGEDDDANGFADDLHGWDFVNQTARLGDWNGHGTHCAGIAAAVGDNKIGVTGANPDALIMPVTVMQSDGTGDVATIIKGIDYAAANGADVISMSIGGYGYSLAEEQALAKAYNTAVLVAAAGNDGKCIYAHDCPVNKKNHMQNGPMFPAAFTFVLGVEASTKEGGLAPFSNFDEDGPVFSQYSEEQLYNYELRAPGAQIMSTFPGGKYKALSGTSMACPYVAGGISRLLQVKEYGNWEILFGDLIHARKHRCEHDHDENVDFEAVYKITDADRKPSLGMVTYVLDDAEGGDGDGKADAGETIALYPTFRNEWGQAKNIRFSLELAEAEDPTIVEILDNEVDFGKELSSYGKNKSANPVRFKVNPDCVDGRHICMVLRATCDNIAEEFEQEIMLTAENGVEIGGMIVENTTLYPGVHYIVNRPIAVPDGVTLTILPGTVLKFKSDTGMSVKDNCLICEGTPEQPIVFTQADLDNGNIGNLDFNDNKIKYAIFENFRGNPLEGKFENCIIRYLTGTPISRYIYFSRSSIYSNSRGQLSTTGSTGYYFLSSNFIGNHSPYYTNMPDFSLNENFRNSNFWGNLNNGNIYSLTFQNSNEPVIYKPIIPNYLGSSVQEIAQQWLYDMKHPTASNGFCYYDLSNMLTRPSAEAHGLVWKIVVNGYDALDEFEQLPPLGVGKHKFEIYFNRPMDDAFTPFVAMGVRPPYTQTSISEDGSWNEDRTVYTTNLTITGKTDIDGLNRIYVADAVESFEDYYLRKELREVSLRTESLVKDVVKVYGIVNLQVSNKLQEGYLTGSTNTLSRLCDGKYNDYCNLGNNDYIQVDLGANRSARFIRVRLHGVGSSSWPSTIMIKGSNDGIVFNHINTFTSSEKNNPLPSSNESASWEASIAAESSFRYYRFLLLSNNSSSSSIRLSELGMEVSDPMVKDNYATLLSEEDIFEIQKHIELVKDLCRDENRDNALLQSALNQAYADYNKLAQILGKDLIEQQPVEVPSAPMWVVPIENTRFNVEVAAAGSMATGLMAEAGLGKVTLTWETDEEDFEDLLGYNIMRYTDHVDSVYVVDYEKYGNYSKHLEIIGDTTIVNPSILEAEEQEFVDYDVVPGTTYYYVIKQLTTSLNSHALSNAVAATPLTASKGDANGSMSVDIADVVTEVAYITYQDPQPFIFEAADVNSDQKVNVLDVVGTIGIITNPAGVGVSGMDNEPVRYYVADGILYVETAQALGGVQVRLNVAKGTEITALDGLKGMEQNGTWLSDEEYLFLAYSMSGQRIPAGTHALLQIGDEAVVTEMVLSDTKGKNITAVNGNTTGIGKVEAVQMQMPSPNPFTTVLRVPYIIGKSGSHEVTISFSDMAGRTIDAYHTENTQGEYTYTWYPRALQKGLYLVSLYVDGELMQTVKVIRE